MKSIKLLFVVAGNSNIGFGHVYRALSLAGELRTFDIEFFCTQKSNPAKEYIEERGYSAKILKANEQFVDSILKREPHIVINDFLDTSAGYIRALKNKNIKVINFEDRGEGAKHADRVINALYDQGNKENVFCGYRYFHLRDEFLNAKKILPQVTVKNIVVTFGGSDPNNLTLKTINIIKDYIKVNGIECTIITGPIYNFEESIKEFLEREQGEKKSPFVWVKGGTKNISKYLERMDMAITSCGRTPYEMAHLCIPTIVIAANERETFHPFPKESGMSYLGRHDLVTEEAFLSTFLQLMDYHTRKSMHKKLEKIDLTNGRKNIMNAIENLLEE